LKKFRSLAMANVAVQADESAEMNDWKLGDLRGNASLRGITGR
jgi:hypothetical protein